MDCNPSPCFAEAEYAEQRIPQYRGNPLIEALPLAETEEQVTTRLFSMPEFDPGQRDWLDVERIQMLAQLASFMVPLERHTQLSYSIDALMRQGYIGRIPHSVASTEVFRKLYEQKTHGRSFDPMGQLTAQLSSSMVGVSGGGKTSAIKRVLQRYPQVIHHPLYGIYQVPYLHIETPYNGSALGLAQAVFRKLDQLLPGAGYVEQYANTRGVDNIMGHVARLLHMHCVGLMVVDEIQNLEHSPLNRQALMTLLVSASNEFGVPLLFVGTYKAKNILSLDFRQSRRSVGYGIPEWGRLAKGVDGQTGEWELFIKVLWRFQWLRNPVEASPFLMDLLYDYSQGIIDIAIKLFACCQLRAMMDGSEMITGRLIADVAHSELAMLEPMIDALRQGDYDALRQFEDIAPLHLGELLAKVQQRYAGRKVSGAAVKPDSEQFKPMVSSALEVLGFDPESADALAEGASEATDALTGVQQALARSRSGKRAQKDKAPPKPVSYLPGDYRNAFNRPEKMSIFEQLGQLGMLPELDVLFAS